MLSTDSHRTIASESDEQPLSDGEVFTLLSNRRRRFVIHRLKQVDGPIRIAKLATHVAAWEQDRDPAEVQYQDRRNVQTTLQRTHLPALAEKDVIRYVDDSVVEPATTLEDVEIYVEVLHGREIPWSVYYTLLAGVSLALLFGTVVELPLVAAVSPLQIALFTAIAFLVSATAQYIVGKRMRVGSDDRPPEVKDQ